MSKMGHGRSLALHVDSHNAVPMRAHDVRRRRLEGYRQHAEGVRVVTVSSLDECNELFGIPGAGFSKSVAFAEEFFSTLDNITVATETDECLRSRVLGMAWAFGTGNLALRDIEVAQGRVLDNLAARYGLPRG